MHFLKNFIVDSFWTCTWLWLVSFLWLSYRKASDDSVNVECRIDNSGSRTCLISKLCFIDDALQIDSGRLKLSGITEEELFNPSGVPHLETLSVFEWKSPLVFKRGKPNMKSLETTLKNVFLIKRFYPYNIHHLWHDDWLPMWYVLNNTWPKFHPDHILAWDNYDIVAQDLLYQYLPKRPSKLSKLSKACCLENVLVGTSKATRWYQYGYNGQQGPLQESFARLSSVFHAVRARFASFLNLKEQSDRILVISRTKDRRILNENELIEGLRKEFPETTVKRIALEEKQQDIPLPASRVR